MLSNFSAGMLEMETENVTGENVRHRVIDTQNISFPDDSFDQVIANMILCHVPDLRKALREVWQVRNRAAPSSAPPTVNTLILDFLCKLFGHYGVSGNVNRAFSLQNGGSLLQTGFPPSNAATTPIPWPSPTWRT